MVGLMSSPEITRVHAARWRMGIAERRWREAVELVREAAAAPDYSGPPLDVIERMTELMVEIRKQVQNWHLDAQIRDTSRPRIATKGQRNSVKRAIARAT
jgi:hypothetical protein